MLTVGHSNRSLEQFLDLLQGHEVSLLVDVRTMPRSRHNPQFNRETLPQMLAARGIAYKHLPGLGGLRHARKDSVNTGWRNASFRGYADYMQTEEFARNLAALCELETRQKTAIMCAEAVPWRCHRSMIADALTIRGVPVMHIVSADKAEPHRLTSFARVQGTRIIYPGLDLELFGPDITP
jgi:uncharacterized protein (DUF488 family)